MEEGRADDDIADVERRRRVDRFVSMAKQWEIKRYLKKIDKKKRREMVGREVGFIGGVYGIPSNVQIS